MSAIPSGKFTFRYLGATIDAMDSYTPEQLLLKQLRDKYCGGVSAELARRIGKDTTYVNRLFYPIGKKGRKGIGLEIMNTCTEVFGLPPGFWAGATEPTAAAPSEAKGSLFDKPTEEEMEFLRDYRQLQDKDRAYYAKEIAEKADSMRAYLAQHLARLGLPVPKSAPAETAQAVARLVVEAAQKDARQKQLFDERKPKAKKH